MNEVEKLIAIYQQVEDAGLMVTAGKKSAAELMVSHDVVPVVRCKDCRFILDRVDGTHGCYRHFMGDCNHDDFCSYGERRTDDRT